MRILRANQRVSSRHFVLNYVRTAPHEQAPINEV
jgi:hypothetical protein